MNLSARFHTLMLWYWILCATLAFGQGARIGSEYGSLAIQTPDQLRSGEQWFRHGRLTPGQSSAGLRYGAHQQRLQLRALRAVGVSRLSGVPHSAVVTVWKPLGPAPLASDASGSGVQDYGW